MICDSWQAVVPESEEQVKHVNPERTETIWNLLMETRNIVGERVGTWKFCEWDLFPLLCTFHCVMAAFFFLVQHGSDL